MTSLDDGTGRYRATAVTAPDEKWRARFRKPSGEGLKSSSSDPYPRPDDDEEEEEPPPPDPVAQPGHIAAR
jgi:hypothetical protein